MSDLKFRAWDGFNGVFLYSDRFSSLATFFLEVEKAIEGGNPITIQQSTGLVDTAGTLIYEGDIIEREKNCLHDEGKVTDEVGFARGRFVVLPDGNLWNITESFGPRVVGHIHQKQEA